MADLTVDALTELTAGNVAANDELGIWDVTASQYKKVLVSSLNGGIMTGGGTVATGGFTLTVPRTGVAATSSGATLTTDDGKILTLPATGTAAALAVANVFSATQRVPKLEVDADGAYIDTDTNFALKFTSLARTVANGGIIALESSVYLLMIINGNGEAGLFMIRGAINTVSEMLESATVFSATKDTATSINVYYDSGYKLQNNTGGSRDVLLFRFGAV